MHDIDMVVDMTWYVVKQHTLLSFHWACIEMLSYSDSMVGWVQSWSTTCGYTGYKSRNVHEWQFYKRENKQTTTPVTIPCNFQ